MDAEQTSPTSTTRRRFLTVLGLGAAASLLAACSGSATSTSPASSSSAAPAGASPSARPSGAAATQAPAQAQGDAALKGEITHWGWAGSLDALKNALPLFNQKFPNLKVNLVEMATNDVRDKLLVSLASGTGAPDSSGLQDRLVPLLIDKGGLVDITDRVTAAGWKDKFAQYKWAAYQDDKGRFFALPWDAAPVGTFYRADLWQQSGLTSDPDKLSDEVQTYDDLIELARKLKGNQKLLPLSTNQSVNRTGSDDLVFAMLAQHQAHMFDDKGQVRDPNPRAVEVLKILKKIVDAGVTVDTSRDDKAEWSQSLKDGVITSEISAVWDPTFFLPAAPDTKGKWKAFRMPAVAKGGPRGSLKGGSSVFMTEQSRNQEATWAFLSFMMTDPKALAVGWEKNQIFPAYLPAFEEPQLNQDDPSFGGQKVARLFGDLLKEIPPLTYTAHWNDGYAATLDAVTSTFKGTSPDQAWAEAIARTRRTL